MGGAVGQGATVRWERQSGARGVGQGGAVVLEGCV